MDAFIITQQGFDRFAGEANFAGFKSHVYPRQVELVIAYVIEAFDILGCPVSRLKEGDLLPEVPCVPKYKKLMLQLHEILEKTAIIRFREAGSVLIGRLVNKVPSHVLLKQLLDDFPQHSSEHRLLGSMGPHLANCLSGKSEALHLMLGGKANKELLEDVYTNGPTFTTGTKLLANFLSKVTVGMSCSKPIQILEVGAGTGSTTKVIVELLRAQGLRFTYTFTDISSSLVAMAQ